MTAPTYLDLARVAGVSKATVDRVMNGRGGVRAHTAQHVRAVWDSMNAAPSAASVEDAVSSPLTSEDRKPPHFDFVIPRGESGFLSALIEGIMREVDRRGDLVIRLHRTVPIEEVDYGSEPLSVPDDSDGVAILASEHPAFRHAIAGLMRRGVPVVTLASDVLGVDKSGYVGIDNLGSGRLAGYLIKRMTAGRSDPILIGAIRGHSTLRGQYEREFGLRQIVQESPELRLAEIVEASTDATREATLQLLKDHPGLAAIYNMTSGNRGVVAALSEVGRTGEIIFVGHDLTAFTQEALLSRRMDFVVDQNARGMAREALNQLAELHKGKSPDAQMMPIGLYCVENLGLLKL